MYGGAYVTFTKLGDPTLKNRSILVDYGTADDADASDAGLPLYQTLHDASVPVSIKPVLSGGSGNALWMDIQVLFQ